MKKEWKAVIAVILSVWLFVMGFELGSYKEKKAIAKNPSTTAPPLMTAVPPTTQTTTSPTELTLFSFDEDFTDPTAQTDDLQALLTTMEVPESTAPAASTAPLTTAPKTTAPATTAAPTTTAPTTAAKADPAKLSRQEVLNTVTAAIRTLKSEQNMNAQKTEATKIVLTECSAKAAVGLVNKALENAGVNETVTYAFRNGKAVGTDASGKAADDGKTVSPRDVIPPAGMDFTLPAAGVESASAKKSGKDTVYTVKLRQERTTLQNPVPPWNAAAIGYVDFSKRNLTGVTLEEVNITYPGSVITVTIGENGKIIRLSEYLPLQGDGKAKVTVFSGTAKFAGDVSATWTFQY